MSSDESMVTMIAEESSDFTGDMVMVHGESCLKFRMMSPTKGATAVLGSKKLIVLLQCDTIRAFQIRVTAFVIRRHNCQTVRGH